MRPSASEPSRQASNVIKFAPIETRSSSSRNSTENDDTIEAARNFAIEIQKDRNLRGLLASIINSDETSKFSLLTQDEDGAEEQPSLVEKYYADA